MYDVFISHASEDKTEIASPLARELKKRGFKVWYDEDVLTLGDSISFAIDEGLSRSKYGIVILSHVFFNKYWTRQEFGGYKAQESKGSKFILPILHGITVEDVRKHSPTLVDKWAISSDVGIVKVADAVEAALNSQGALHHPHEDKSQDRFTFLPEMSLSEMADFFAEKEKQNLCLIGSNLKKFLAISCSDTEMAIIKANIIVQSILAETCRSIHGHKPDTGTEPLEFLRSRGQLGEIVARHCEAVKSFSELASEARLERDESSFRIELDMCKQSLKVILNWYMSSYSEGTRRDGLTLVRPGEFTVADIEELYRIETVHFDPNLITPLNIAIEWYNHNPETLFGVRDKTKGNLAGFFNALPVSEELFEQIETGLYIDTHIPLDDIRLFDLPDLYKMYLCSFCIHPDYRHTNAFRIIIDGFIDFLLELSIERDIHITEVIADAITKKGQELCRFAGMREVTATSHGSKIYKAVLLPPSLRMRYKNGKRLTEFYERVYNQYRELI